MAMAESADHRMAKWNARSRLPHAEREGYGSRLVSRSAVILLLAVAFPSFAQELPADAHPAIVFHETIEAARESSPTPRPMIVSFGADWCSWCRKLENETFVDATVAARGGEFLWVKLDVEENEELAARFRVRGVPHTAVLDGEDRLLAGRSGYMGPEDFLDFLDAALTNPLPADTQDTLLARFRGEQTAAEDRAAVTAIIEQLAKSDRAGRRPLLEALSKKGPPAWPPLADLLSDKRLAVRAAAATALAQATGGDVDFRPFDPAEDRALSLAAWQAWLEEHAAEALARHRAIPPQEDPPLPVREDLAEPP